MLSSYQLKTADLHNIPIGTVKKLVPNFFDKEMYVFYYDNLQLYLRLQQKIKKILRVLKVNQSQWLKPYVEFNTKKNEKAFVQVNEQFCVW